MGKVISALNGKHSRMAFYILSPTMKLKCYLEKAIKDKCIKKVQKKGSKGTLYDVWGYARINLTPTVILMPLNIIKLSSFFQENNLARTSTEWLSEAM